MDVSSGEDLKGTQLIETVVSLTELPHSLVQEELGQIIKDSGHTPEGLTIDQLREAMIAYLESLQATYLADPSEVDDSFLHSVKSASE